jgi:hypothetical protein
MSRHLIEALTQELAGSGGLETMGGMLGTDESTTANAMAAVLPTLITALARNTSDQGGAEDLFGALERDHDGSVMNDLPGFFEKGADPDDGNAILGHVLGDRRPTVEQGLSKGSGVDLSVIQALLPLVAPIVLGYLGRKQRQREFGPEDLSGYLRDERDYMERQAPAEANLGGLASLLDMDRDGDITDDAVRIGSSLLEQYLSSRK